MNRPLLSLLLIAALSGCKYSDKWVMVNTNNQFAVNLPPYMEKSDKLKPGAPLQYSSRYRSTYIVGFSDKKSAVTDSFPVYESKAIQVFKNVLTKPQVTDSSVVEINGLKGIRTEIFGKMGDETIYYSHVSLLGKDNLYQICVWTRGEDRKLKYKADIEKIIGSFKEI